MDFDDPGFRELIDALHDGVYITDADGITLKVNSAYERLTGLRAEDVVGQHMQALVEQGVISQSVSLRVLKEGKALSLMQSVSQGKRLLLERHGDIGTQTLGKERASKAGEILQRREQGFIAQLLAGLLGKQAMNQR